MTKPAVTGPEKETEEVTLGPGIVTLPRLESDGIDDVLPEDLPRVNEVQNERGIWYIHFVDYALDRERESSIRALFRAKQEKIAEGDLAILQMQENVDPSLIPSPSVIIGVLTQMIQNFDAQAVAKVWAFSTFSAYYSAHDNSKANLMTATGYLEGAEWVYQLFYLKFKRLSRNYKERYGEGMLTLAEIEKRDPTLYWHLRDKLPLKRDTETGQIAQSDKNRMIRWWYERLVMDRGDQAERLYDLLRQVLWTAEGHLNAVFQKSKGYAKGAAGLSAWKKSARDNQKSLENKSTTVHTTVETEK